MCIAGAVLASTACADVRMHKLFSDDMLLQRDTIVPVYGYAEPGEEVTVKFGDQTVSAKAGLDGRWMVKLQKMPANSNPQDMTVTGKNTITLKNILVGDVWLASGQSNMAFGLGGCNAPKDIETANYPQIRFITLPIICEPYPTWDVETKEPWFRWNVCNPGNAGNISAVAFYFARIVQKEAGVPIGLLVSSVGGTNIEKWMPKTAFDTTPELADFAKNINNAIEDYKKDLAGYLETGMSENNNKLASWKQTAGEALKVGKDIPSPPELVQLPLHPSMPGSRAGGYWLHLYNGMIAPLGNFPIKGALWYQGENNSEEENTYTIKMRAMIESWRKLWGIDFPFYYVQLANWLQPSDVPSGEDKQYKWQLCRMGQLKALSIPKTGMAVIIDVGDAADIHPRDKFDVGKRLALWALAKDYGQSKLVYSGPLYKDIKVEGNKIRVSFDSTGSGLMIAEKKGLEPAVEIKGGKLKRFAIAGADKKWVWADAKIDGKTVVVSSPEVPNPVAVRYAFSINPEGANLYNKEGLPASPFRSDDW